MPNSHTLREHINKTFESEKIKIQGVLKTTGKLSFTADGWDSMSVDPYLGLTCHFIDDDWVMREILLIARDHIQVLI